MGKERPEITPLPVRFMTVPRSTNYIVIYRPDTIPIRILAVVHGMQNLKALLADPKFRG